MISLINLWRFSSLCIKATHINEIIKNKVMKTILTFLMPLIAIVTGIASYNLFTEANYYLSAIFTVVSWLSASIAVYLVLPKTKVVLH